jgi:uroporphyrin-III C-methyltransferase
VSGFVSLVGAGPGDPELLTLRALDRLKRADLVLNDALVPEVVTELAPKAKRFYVGKRAGRHSIDQDGIHKLMVIAAKRGQRVVRLKAGDPFVFGRGGEEFDALRAAGIDVEVVPGITAGIAAPAAIGIAVTDRRHAPGVAFVTGHAQPGGAGADWAALARSGLTLVVYMGVAQAGAISAALIAGGLAGATPAAAIGAAHTPRQRSVTATLATLAAAIDRASISSPAILVIGNVAAAAREPGLQEGLSMA